MRFRIRMGLAVAALSLLATPLAHAQTAAKSNRKRPTKPSATKPISPIPALSADAFGNELARLSRALRDNPNSTTYASLSAFAARNPSNETGARAALALGYYDLTREKPDLALVWMRKAVGDKLLREYVLYWQAQVSLALGQKEAALEQLHSLRREYPRSAMTELAVTSLAEAALALGKGEDALAALESYPGADSKPSLLLLRAEAREKVAATKGEKPAAAAADYLDLYYRFPLNDEAKTAGEKIPALQAALGEAFPGTPMQTQLARAEAFYLAKRWREASAEFAALLPKLSGADHQRAALRVAQCEVEQGGRLDQLNEVALADPELDAERVFTLAETNRSQKIELLMLGEVGQLVQSYPRSIWTAGALFGAGNYYWINLDRGRAAEFYRRSLEASPEGRYAPVASWRVAWISYLDRKPEAADLLEDYVRRFPASNYIPDALYWLGRANERSGNPEHARSFYLAAANRFPLTYFGERAAERIRPEPYGIGDSPVNPADFLSVIPAAPSLAPLDPRSEAAAEEQQARARALSDIAFDSSAELEYRAAYAATRAPKFLIDAAGAAIAAGHYGAGIAEARQAFPQLEARHISEIPNDVWRAAFPLPYETSLRGTAARYQLDPMLVAGLIRQESAFESKAMSHAGAVGLMQVMPQTALKVARQLRVRYARLQLTDPGYNLELGSRYLANLLQAFGTREAALAAYNAGEDRVTEWTTGQNYLETPEFVESIPFTETRDYVQIVMRNAEIYRQVYASLPARPTQPTHPPMHRSGKAGSSREAAMSQPASAGETHPARAGETR